MKWIIHDLSWLSLLHRDLYVADETSGEVSLNSAAVGYVFSFIFVVNWVLRLICIVILFRIIGAYSQNLAWPSTENRMQKNKSENQLKLIGCMACFYGRCCCKWQWLSFSTTSYRSGLLTAYLSCMKFQQHYDAMCFVSYRLVHINRIKIRNPKSRRQATRKNKKGSPS